MLNLSTPDKNTDLCSNLNTEGINFSSCESSSRLTRKSLMPRESLFASDAPLKVIKIDEKLIGDPSTPTHIIK